MEWRHIKYADAIHHTVAEPFAEMIKADLWRRDCGDLEKDEVKNTYFMDLPGSVLVGEPMEKIELDGLTITVPCKVVSTMVNAIPKLQARDGGYVKIHGFYACLVVSVEQLPRLVAALQAVREQAEQRWTECFTQWGKRFEDPKAKAPTSAELS